MENAPKYVILKDNYLAKIEKNNIYIYDENLNIIENIEPKEATFEVLFNFFEEVFTILDVIIIGFI